MAIRNWYLTLNFDSGIESVKFNYGSNEHVFATSGEEYTVGYEPDSAVYLTATMKEGYSLDTMVNDGGVTIGTVNNNVVTIPLVESGFNYTWIMSSKQSGVGSTMKFKHFYDAGTIGSGTYKFRHYSQQEPSSGETWVLNENLSGALTKTTVNFTSNNEQFTNIRMSAKGDLFYGKADTTETTVYFLSWSDEAYRTITFDEPVTDTTLLAWLQANGTKQGGGAVTGIT